MNVPIRVDCFARFGNPRTCSECPYIATSADKVIAGRYLGAAALGIYGRAYHLMSVPADLYARVGDRLVFPALAACQTDRERLRRAFLSGTSVAATLGLPMSVALMMLAPEIITFLLGENWIGVIGPLTLLAAASYFRLGAKVSGSLLRATGSFKSLIWSQAAYAAAMVGGCIAAAPHGVVAIAGVASAVVIGFFIVISAMACARTSTPLGQFLAQHIHGLLLSLVTAATLGSLLFVLRDLRAPDYAILFATAAALSAIGAGLLFWPQRWLIGATVAELVKDFRVGAVARLGRLNPIVLVRTKGTSA